MALKYDITAADGFYYDTDNVLEYTIAAGRPALEDVQAGVYVPRDVTGWSIGWTMRKKVDDVVATIHKETGGNGVTITGTYDSDPQVNTQRVEVFIQDEDTYDTSTSPVVNVLPGTYFYALKRLDTASERILAEGKITLVKVAAWE
jgi:hypothetical protein